MNSPMNSYHASARVERGVALAPSFIRLSAHRQAARQASGAMTRGDARGRDGGVRQVLAARR